jgi:DNA-binding GntR family transcriptional regulator
VKPAATDSGTVSPGPIVVSSVQMAVRDRLRHDILSGTFPAGTRLQQSEIAHSYQVSVTPVREALRELAADGLVDFGPFSGAIVHAATIVELQHLYEVRAHLYPLATRSAVEHITDAQLDEAQWLVDEMGRTSPIDTWAHHNRQFHRVLDSAVQNTYLADILMRLGDVAYLYVHISDRGTGRRPSAHTEHQEMVDAFRCRDTDEAMRLAVLHVTNTLEHAKAVLNESESGPDGVLDGPSEGQSDASATGAR